MGGVADLCRCAAVIFTRSRWHEVPRARQQVARQLARFCPVVFAETPIDWRASSRAEVETVAPNIVRCSLGNPAPIPHRVLRHVEILNGWVQHRYVHDLFVAVGSSLRRNVVLINFNPDFGTAAALPAFAVSVYFCNDDFSSLVRGECARREVTRQERLTAANADLCLAVSTPLVEKLRPWNANAQLFLPGHEFASRKSPNALSRMTDHSTRVGFMGYINDRVNFGWLQRAADQPDIMLELAGPIETSTPALKALLSSPRVRYHGVLNGEALQTMLGDMDVLVMPYASAAGMAAATAPNKLFAYLAAEKPIVIGGMPCFLDLGAGLIYRANTPEEFATQIRHAYDEDCNTLREKRRTIAAANTWDVRGDRLRVLIEGILDSKAAPPLDSGVRTS